MQIADVGKQGLEALTDRPFEQPDKKNLIPHLRTTQQKEFK